MSEEQYDVVLSTLREKRNLLWKMTESNMNMDMMNVMDDIRLEQIDQLDKAIEMWKAAI
jgi:KaiC/GvpD/RAD55 family RecA-like ATPase